MSSKPSRKRDALGAALLLLFGVLYMSGWGGEQRPTPPEVTVTIGEVSPVMPGGVLAGVQGIGK